MRVTLESGLGLLILAVLVAAFAGSLTRRFSLPATREEAIEVSKSGVLMRGYMAEYPYFWVKSVLSAENIFERVPEGHSLWRVHWFFSGGPPSNSQGGSSLFVFVDADSWVVAAEVLGVAIG